MNTGLLLIMILALVIVEGTIVIAMLLSNEMRIREALEEIQEHSKQLDTYVELITNLFKQSHKYEESLSEDMLQYSAKCDTQTKNYIEFCKVAEKMCERYTDINNMQTELLNAWEKYGERYDQTYEEFKFLSDELKKLNAKDERRTCVFDEKQLCPYDECAMSDCLVFIQKSVEDPTLQDPIRFGGNKND